MDASYDGKSTTPHNNFLTLGAAVGSGMAGPALYERVGACVNRSIGELLKGRRAVRQGDAFYQDLAPNILMESFAASERRALDRIRSSSLPIRR